MLKRNLKLLSAAALTIPLVLNTSIVTAHSNNLYKNAAASTRGTFDKADFKGDLGKDKGVKEGIKTKLDSLVDAGTITEDQETAVLNIITPANSASENSQTERGNHFGNLKTKLDSLVTAGTITEDQETAIYNLFVPPTSKGKNSQAKSGSPFDDFKTKLDSLVTAGTITKAQEVTVLKLFTASINMEQDSQTSPQNPFDDFKTDLDNLVTTGTITEEQETAIFNILQPADIGSGGPSDIGNGGQNGTSSTTTTTTGTAVYIQNGGTESKTDQTITASNANESGVKVTNGGTLTLTNSTIATTGSTSSEDNSNFYGLNAAVLAESGSNITLSNTIINTSGSGANAVFATGSGSSITLSGVTIKTTADSSRGLDATLTGTINATNVNITTAGTHCAGLATDRGQGTVNVTGAAITTNGTDSPGIYSTGKITAANSTITANGSEAAVVEGRNSIDLTNTALSGAKKRGVMLYQSYSGDAEVGTSRFTMNGGSLIAAEGPLFYATNTDAVIELKDVKATTTSAILLAANADSWGTTGSNGANVTFTADTQTLKGDITCDNISTVSATIKNSSVLTGAINTANTAKSMELNVDSSSTWNVTGDSYLTSFTDADTTLSNINSNNFTIYYDSSSTANSWLGGKTYTLNGGGNLTPISK